MLNAKTARIFDSNRSGSIVITQNELSSCGDPEIYLKINFPNGTFRYLSAPLHSPVDVRKRRLSGVKHHLPGGPSRRSIPALVNPHCVYQVL